ncbi:DUF4236 domain-containing protein [Rhizobium sp. SL86]|uniref:DUF4236 domain-containing protein n=1 Tax=Rhizobium sp. SL86 TaxID=2995148 RepID=UPI002274B317|nr:DUF4236 domain-containing protein [Rhizobium sp. SL86]MCY1668059.1 DUF4236 domain-containing protein [Rhizobium sp. SL86]
MAFKFRRTLKIAPGLRLNLTHRGVSARVGTKGAGYTVNTNGSQHVSAGVPGTGVHVSKQLTPGRKRKHKSLQTADEGSASPSFGRIVRTGFFMALGGLVVIIVLAMVK